MADSQPKTVLGIDIRHEIGLTTNVTKTIHRSSYPAIDPTRPELSQEGRSVLISGGGTGIGLAISKAFVQAGAKTIIIASRREDVLANAKDQLEHEGHKAGKATQVIAHKLDVTDKSSVAALWSDLKDQGVGVDVLVLNSAKFSLPGSLFEHGSDEVWSLFEANVHGPLMMAEAFAKQGGDSHKSIVNVATSAIHIMEKSQLVLSWRCPAYGLTKNAGTLTMQQIARHSDPEKMQVVSYHPGIPYSDAWKSSGTSEDMFPYDDFSLSGSAAVWMASPEARFLHGRFVWASWDVDELKTGEIRRRIEEKPDFLKIGMLGLYGAQRTW